MRVWWRSDDAWRVDKLLATGETDLIHNVQGDDAVALRAERRGPEPRSRHPAAADRRPGAAGGGRPAARGRRRSPSVRAAARGPRRRASTRSGCGWRPPRRSRASTTSTCGPTPTAACVLRVVVVGKGADTRRSPPSSASSPPATPPAERTTFVPPAGADFDFDDVLDIADAANQYAPVAAARRPSPGWRRRRRPTGPSGSTARE